MWERFDKFANTWLLAALDDCVTSNAKRSDGDGRPEQWVCGLRTEFAQMRGPTTTGSVLVLQRSSWTPTGLDIPSGVDPADPLAMIGSFPEDHGGGAWATWWLTFLPGDGPQDEWRLARADTQDRAGRRVAVDDLAPLRALSVPKPPAMAWPEQEVAANGPANRLAGPASYESAAHRRAAKAGRPLHMFLYGLALEREAANVQAVAEGREWIARAAQYGQAHAQIVLARRLALGEGVERDVAAGAELYWRAAAQGKDRARCILGDLAAWGIGVPKDAVLAQACYRAGAANGHAPSQWRLAKVIDDRLNPVDDERFREARRWARAAAMAGDHEAMDGLYTFASSPFAARVHAGEVPWPGECRARVAAWLKGRVSRASEREATEALLRIAETIDDILAAGTVSPAQVEVLVAMARSDDGFQFSNTGTYLKRLQMRGIELSPVLVALAGQGKAHGRLTALECLAPGTTPAPTIARVIELTREDRDRNVRFVAQQKAAEFET